MGDNSTSSTSTPLTAEQRTALYNAAGSALGGQSPMSFSEYAARQGWGGGDRAAEQRMYADYLAGANAGNALNARVSGIQYAPAQYVQLADAATAGVYDPGTGPGGARSAPIYDPGIYSGSTLQGYAPAQTLTGGDYDRLERQLAQGALNGLWANKGEDLRQMNESLNRRGIYSSGIAARAENDLNSKYADTLQQALSNAAVSRYGMQANELSGLNNYNLSATSNTNQERLAQNQAQNQYNLARSAALSGQSQFNTAAQNARDMEQAQYGLNRSAALANQGQFNANAMNANNALRYQGQNQFNAAEAQNRYNAQWRPIEYLGGLWSGTNGVVSSSSGSGWSI